MTARDLSRDLCRMRSELASLLRPSPSFLLPLRHHVLRSDGKGLRGRLMLILGYLCGAPRRPLVTAAAAVEAVHLATLIHDDIVDGATRRRRTGALHRAHGIAPALLYGDLIFARGVAAVNSLGMGELTDRLLESAHALCSGEILEAAEAGGFPWKEATYLRIVELKTASLFTFACEAPAILAGCPRGRLRLLRRLGGHLGFAFQIADDCRDFAPRSGGSEKDRLLDLKNQVPSFPTVLAGADKQMRPVVRAVLAGGGGGRAMERLGGYLRRHGVLRRAAARAGLYLVRARRDAAGIRAWGEPRAAGLLDGYMDDQYAQLAGVHGMGTQREAV